MLKHNFILVSVANINIKEISQELANKLGYYYLNIEDLIDYELFDKDEMADICGINYVENQQKKIVQNINSYEKSLISMNYETFSNYISIINRDNKIIYLKVSKEKIEKEMKKLEEVNSRNFLSENESNLLANFGISLIVYEERDKFLKKNCDFEVICDISNVDKTVSLIYEKIKE